MGKVSKRQRKFLSKNLLPHRKKGGARRTDGKDKQGAPGGTFAAEKQPSAAPQERKTLPNGVDTEAFLECPWLSQKSCTASATDNNVDPFRVEESVLESRAKSVSVSNKRSTPSCSSRDSGLSAETVQAMLERSVDEGSVNELILTVRSLELSFSRSASPPSAAEIELRTEPGSRAWNTLRKDGFGRLHVAFMAHLGPNREGDDSIQEWEEAAHAHRQQFVKAKAWPHLGSALLAFLTASLDSLGMPETETETTAAASKAHTEDAHKRGIIVEGLARMRYHLPFLFPFPRLARRYLSYLLGILETTDDGTSISLAFLRLYELSTSQPMPFLHDAFKGAYRTYRAAAERIGGDGRSAVIGVRSGVIGVGGDGNESLSLLRECLAELFGVEKPSAYLHAYVFIHELVREALAAAAEVAKLGAGVREAGPALRRLRSWGFLQRLLLWTSVVGTHAGKASLGPLVHTLTKVLEISFQLSPGLFGAPRTLALARSAQNLAAAAGIYLPTSQHLIGLLELLYPSRSGVASSKEAKERLENKKTQEEDSNSGGKKWRSGFREEGGVKGDDAGDIVDLSAVAGLGKEDLRLGAVQAAVSRKAANLIVREMTCYRWSAGLPELCASTQARLERLLEGEYMSADGGASGRCRARLKSTIAAVGRASAEAAARRGRGDKHPGEAAPIDTFRDSEEPSATQRLQLFKEPF